MFTRTTAVTDDQTQTNTKLLTTEG